MKLDNYILKTLNSDQLSINFIALDEGKAIGMCNLLAYDGISKDLSPWITDLVVDKYYQSHGIGGKLLDVATKKARDLNYDSLYLFVLEPKLQDYYTKKGFKTIGKDVFDAHGIKYDVHVMQKNIGNL